MVLVENFNGIVEWVVLHFKGNKKHVLHLNWKFTLTSF